MSAAQLERIGRAHIRPPEGFAVHPREWWHFDHESWHAYPVLDLSFDELATAFTAGVPHD